MISDRDLIYDVPSHLAKDYRGKSIKLRSTDPGLTLESLTEEELHLLISLKIEDLDCAIEPLQNRDCPVPLELILMDPVTDFHKLYRFSGLVESFPIRACIPLHPGFGKVVRVAAALHLAIKLELGQPDASVIEELIDVLDFYLHSPGVTEPIDFFHSLLQARYSNKTVSLWEIQEEAPYMVRHVDAEGKASFPGRLMGENTLPEDPAGLQECNLCSHRGYCEGYFKWPDNDYDCEGIKKVLSHIEAAAEQLRADVRAAEVIAP